MENLCFFFICMALSMSMFTCFTNLKKGNTPQLLVTAIFCLLGLAAAFLLASVY